MSSLVQRRHKSVVVGPTTTNEARGARPGRRMWPRSHSGPNPAAGKLPMIMEVAAVGDAMPRLKPSLLPGRQPPPALFTPAVRTKPHKTGDLPGARREKLASKIIGAAAPDHDHGQPAAEAWRTKSETAPTAPPSMILKPRHYRGQSLMIMEVPAEERPQRHDHQPRRST